MEGLNEFPVANVSIGGLSSWRCDRRSLLISTSGTHSLQFVTGRQIERGPDSISVCKCSTIVSGQLSLWAGRINRSKFQPIASSSDF